MKEEYDLSGRIIGLAMKVHSSLGPGFLEKIYHNALIIELEENGIEFESEKSLQVKYKGRVVGDFFADLLITNELIVEIKAVQQFAVVHEVQLVNYLNATGIDDGLLVNFGFESLEFKRKYRMPLVAKSLR